MGHLSLAKKYHWSIKEIAIYPYGGCVKLDTKINHSLKEELFIMLAGPTFQIIFYLLITTFFKNSLSPHDLKLLTSYNATLLIFNLLPIYPLDGGKLLNIIMNYLLPYKKGNLLTIYISLIMLIASFCLFKNINTTLMIALLFTEIISYLKNQDYLYNKLLLERYLENFNFSKHQILKNKNNFYQMRKHTIYYQNKYITEKEYLKKRFLGK